MSSAISRLWSRQMRTVWDVHHFVICSHLLIISVITLFVMLRIWSAQSDNVQVYSMSGRGEVWMNGDPHLWLSLTGLTPLTESVYSYYDDDKIDGDNVNVLDDFEYNFANTYLTENDDNNGVAAYVSVNAKSNNVTNVKKNDAVLSKANSTIASAKQETILPHLIEEYRKLYQKRMSVWNRYNSLLNSKTNDNAKDVTQQAKQVQFRLPVPVAAVIVQGAEITPAIASKDSFYGDRLISAYRFALLSGAPWLLITCYSETECIQVLHFLLTTPDIANVLFDQELLHMMSYPKNETGSVLRESLLHSNTLQEWMLRGALLGSLPCSFSTRNKFTCYNSREWYYHSLLHHHHHHHNEQELEYEEEEEWSSNFANTFANSAVHESIDVNEKLAYELLESYEEDLFLEEQEELEEEEEEENEENDIDSIHGYQIHNSDKKGDKQENVNRNKEFVVVNSFTKIDEYEEELKEEQEEEENANVLTVEFVHGHNNNVRYNIGDEVSSSKSKNNNMHANTKYAASGRKMRSKTQHLMKAYYPRYIIHEGIRFIQPGIVMVQKNVTSTVAEPTVKILQELIEMNAAEKHKMWRLSQSIAKRKTVEYQNKITKSKKPTELSIVKNKHATSIEPEPEILLVDDKHINEQHAQTHETNVNLIVNMNKEKSHSKAERAHANESQSERTVKTEKEKQQPEEWEKEMNKVQVEPWWWWLNEEHVVFVVTSVGEQTRARLIFTKAIRDVGHDALVRLRSLIAKLLNERQNELHVINKNTDSAYVNVNHESNSKHGENETANKYTLLLPRNLNYANTVQKDDVHLPFASMQEYTKLFVLRPYMTGNIELFRSNGLLLPFDNKLPENMPAHCSWLARKIGVYSYYFYRNYQRLLNDFISYGSSTGGYISDLSQLNILTNDYEAGRISLQDINIYD